MTSSDRPSDRETHDDGHRRAGLWLAGVTAVAGLIAASAALISAVRG
ncbi:hypothetical protein ACWDUX_29040 [Streptomyces sp. NPDC003444]